MLTLHIKNVPQLDETKKKNKEKKKKRKEKKKERTVVSSNLRAMPL